MITAFTCLSSYRHSSFTLQAYLCWRHTYCQWPIIELTMNVSQIHMHARFPWSIKWPTYHVAVCCTNRKRSSFATKHFQRKSQIFRPSSVTEKVSIGCGTNKHMKSEMLSSRHTHTQTHRPSTVTLAAHAHHTDRHTD